MRISKAPYAACLMVVDINFLAHPSKLEAPRFLPRTRLEGSIRRVFACFAGSISQPRTLSQLRFLVSIGIKTSATASSYVFLQQELARGLRLSQPSRVAKDAARGEL